MKELLKNFLIFIESDPLLDLAVSALVLAALAIMGHFFVKFVLRYVTKLAAPHFNEIVREIISDDKLFGRLALFIPTLVLYQGVKWLSMVPPSLSLFTTKIAVLVAIVIGLSILTRLMFKGNEIYSRYPISRTRPIKGYLQIVTIGLYSLGIIVAVASLLGKSPVVFLSGLGAMTAVIMLVFRDTLLSLVAGIQLTTNDLIRVGDWIEMPQFGADGDVVDIALHTVKVQNWDKTITVIPAHKFLEHSFRNWRGMSEAGGRRIKRSVFIDMSTIRFLDEEEVDRFGQYALLKEYITNKKNELAEHNRERTGSGVLVANARRLTNVGTFRAYLIHYLRQHPGIHRDMTFLVRQLQPTAEGLPIEVYVFSKDTRWSHYENLQADIFDHILSVVEQFGLRVFQQPSGLDFKGLLLAGSLAHRSL